MSTTDNVKIDAINQAKDWGLSETLINNIKSSDIQSFFPIQQQAIQGILHGNPNADICVSAPTGSGKTLVYVLPIIQLLEKRIVPRVRALIVVPSRDLAIQVKSVFDTYCINTPLKTALAIGQSKFADEQMELVGVCSSINSLGLNLFGNDRDQWNIARNIVGGHSLIDILIATPGRLVDHLRQTPGFTLQHLQFLVIDEADRLLTQSYYGWTEKIYQSVFRVFSDNTLNQEKSLDPRTIRSRPREIVEDLETTMRIPFRQMLFSATLTRNPKKLAILDLQNPTVFSVGRENSDVANVKGKHLYSTPKNLDEYMLECSIQEKPLVLLKLLADFQGKLTVVFTASVNATHRLTRLLQLYGIAEGKVREFSSSLSQKQRTKLLMDCRSGDVNVLIASDAMARGMDINTIEFVINYDVPVFIKTYIHRIGRTARGTQAGICITLIKKDQIKGFRRLLTKVDNSFVRQYQLDRESMQSFVHRYTQCLKALKNILDQEKAGILIPSKLIDQLN